MIHLDIPFSLGRVAAQLRSERARRWVRLKKERSDYFDQSDWNSAVSRSQTTARNLFTDAVTWMLLGLYTSGVLAEFDTDIAFLRARRDQIGPFDRHSERPEEGWINLRRALVADAVLNWCATGLANLEAIRFASQCFDDRTAFYGGASQIIAESTVRKDYERLELMFAPEFVRRVLTRDWAWIQRTMAAGFSYLEQKENCNSNGLLILYCKNLMRVATSNSQEGFGDCKQTLADTCWSWTHAFLADRPWESAVGLLHLSIYAFCAEVMGEAPTILAVNEFLQGVSN